MDDVTGNLPTRFQRAMAVALSHGDDAGWDIPPWAQEESLLESGQLLKHHRIEDCSGQCCLHGTSPHASCRMPRSWRSDRQILEHHCSHGIGHPCAAGMEYAEAMGMTADGLHGCDGCCMTEPESMTPAPVPPMTYAEALNYLMDIVESLQADRDRHSAAIGGLKRDMALLCFGLVAVLLSIAVAVYVLG